MKLRGSDKLAMAVLLILAALWGSSYLLSVWIAVDWNNGASSMPTIAQFVILHSHGRLQLIRSPVFVVGTPPVWITSSRNSEGFRQIVAGVMPKDAPHDRLEPLPGLSFDRSVSGDLFLLSVPYVYPFVLGTMFWAAPWLWRRWRAIRRRRGGTPPPLESPAV